MGRQGLSIRVRTQLLHFEKLFNDLLFYCDVLPFDPPNFESKGGNGCKGNPTSATAGGGGGYYGGGGGCVITRSS